MIATRVIRGLAFTAAGMVLTYIGGRISAEPYAPAYKPQKKAEVVITEIEDEEEKTEE